MRKERGCLVMSEEPVVQIDDVEFYSCLCHDNFQHPDYGLFYELYKNFKNGLLPFSGAYLEQPAQIMEAISYMDQLHIEKEIEDSKNQSKEKDGG